MYVLLLACRCTGDFVSQEESLRRGGKRMTYWSCVAMIRE